MARGNRPVPAAANAVNAAAGDINAQVGNVCAWISILAQRISEEGINLRIKRTDDGHWAVNISIPEIKPEE